MTLLGKGSMLGNDPREPGNHWEIEKLLGKGACGCVYSVSPLDEINRQTGVKSVAKCIEYGKDLSKKAAKDQERISITLNHERNLLAPGQILSLFKFRPKIPPKYYHGKDQVCNTQYLG
jgi:hypothetical protein